MAHTKALFFINNHQTQILIDEKLFCLGWQIVDWVLMQVKLSTSGYAEELQQAYQHIDLLLSELRTNLQNIDSEFKSRIPKQLINEIVSFPANLPGA